jgi:hypothetical protein
MPEYTNLPILDEIEVLVSKHKSHPIPEPEAMKAVQVILNKYVKAGVENAKNRLKYVTEQRDSCKKTLERMEALLQDLKAPDYIPEMYKLHECKAGVQIIQLTADGVHKDGATMFAKMGQFRGNWGPAVAKLCKDTAFINSFIAARTGSMALGTQAAALQERVDEYVKRAALIAAEAEKVRNGAAQDSKQITAEATKLVEGIEAAETEAAKGLKAAASKLKTLTSLKTQSVYTGKEHKVAESFVADIEKERKGVAGQYKTAEQHKARLHPLLVAKAFILGPVKLRFDKAWVPLEKYKAEAKKYKEDADKVFLELAKRLKK